MVRQRVTVTTLSLLAILPAAPDLPAQEVIDLPGRDQPLDADFEEIFRVGVVEGEDWEMFANVASVAFDVKRKPVRHRWPVSVLWDGHAHPGVRCVR